jgi:hypothetical protein
MRVSSAAATHFPTRGQWWRTLRTPPKLGVCPQIGCCSRILVDSWDERRWDVPFDDPAKRDELADKLRQPLGELVADNKIQTIREMRLMRYQPGPKK